MNKNMFALASDLTDQDLLARIDRIAATEREASAQLVAHLAVLDTRPSLYAAQGHGSLFSYCTRALHFSEDAACSRIVAARACRRFPAILDALSAGEVSLTSIRMLGPHLTSENHEVVLARARRRTRSEIEGLVAELAPRLDVPSSVRKVAVPSHALPSAGPNGNELAERLPSVATPAGLTAVAPAPPVLAPPTPRPIVQATSPRRYRVQFTIGQESHDKLRRLQALLRREIPDGDPSAIFDRALTLLLEKVEKAKWGATSQPAIRSGTDRPTGSTTRASRYRPRHVGRAAWQRDEGQCGFISKTGLRCTERAFLEFHHIEPYARGGPATVENISLRCRRHNQYEGELVFGKRRRPDSA
jgi:hypothetical protein